MKNKPAEQAADADHPDEALPMDKINPFSKIAVTFEPVMRFGCTSDFRFYIKIVT